MRCTCSSRSSSSWRVPFRALLLDVRTRSWVAVHRGHKAGRAVEGPLAGHWLCQPAGVDEDVDLVRQAVLRLAERA